MWSKWFTDCYLSVIIWHWLAFKRGSLKEKYRDMWPIKHKNMDYYVLYIYFLITQPKKTKLRLCALCPSASLSKIRDGGAASLSPHWHSPCCWTTAEHEPSEDCVDSSGLCVCPPACMVSTRWVGGSAGREWERWERGRWNTEGSSPATHSECQKVERDREGGVQTEPTGTVISRGANPREWGDSYAERKGGKVAGDKGVTESQQSKGWRGEQKRWDVSGTRGRGERAAGVGGRVTGRDGGVGAWGVLMISGAGGYRDGWWKDGRGGRTFDLQQ